MNLLYRWAMQVMVFKMRLMTRYLPWIAHPIVAWVAEREVIACGLRSADGSVRFIFTPTLRRGAHRIVKRGEKGWHDVASTPAEDFSGELVKQVTVAKAENGEVYRVVAPRVSSGHLVRSPKITIKPETPRRDEILSVQPDHAGAARLSWHIPKGCEAMIFFVTVEDSTGTALSGIYTRETQWTYPHTKKASLSVGEEAPPLTPGESYTAKLVIVDFDGWVSCLATHKFTA